MSKIEWLARPGTKPRSWNPITGCTRVSPGCENCYAETMSHRLSAMGQEKYQGVTKPSGKWSGKILLHEDVLDEPLKWRKPSTVFVCSMSDLFHEDVPDEFIGKVMAACSNNPEHTFLILTKRAARLGEWIDPLICPIGQPLRRKGWPENIWLGVSVEDQQRADERISHLLKIPAAVRFLSVEPLLGPVDLNRNAHPFAKEQHKKHLMYGPAAMNKYQAGAYMADCPKIHWVIAGGESGPGARPCNIDWIRSVVDQCAEASVPCFVKQLGSEPREIRGGMTGPRSGYLGEFKLNDGHGRSKRSDPAILEAHGLNIREWPT